MESRCRDAPVPAADAAPISGGTSTLPSPWEVGRKDSALAPGGQITRSQATLDHVSRYVRQCHFLDHEDNGMMRPWQCLPY